MKKPHRAPARPTISEKMWSLRILFVVLVILLGQRATGQSDSSALIFLHLDKSAYQAGETIWFAGYILNREQDVLEKQHIQYVSLVDAVDRKVVANGRWALNDGFGAGDLSIPDSVLAGEYWLLAYTNASLEGKRSILFRTLIAVRSQIGHRFTVGCVSSLKDYYHPGGWLFAYKVSMLNGALTAGGKFTYTLFEGSDSVRSGTVQIDAMGIAQIEIPHETLDKPLEMAIQIRKGESTERFLIPVLFPGLVPRDPLPIVQQAQVSILPDSIVYHPRSLIQLTIKLHDVAGNPLQGTFSLSAALASRTDSLRQPIITRYESEARVQASADIAIPGSPQTGIGDIGQVLQYGKPLKKPVSLAMMGYHSAVFTTDSTGRFVIPASAEIVPPGTINYLSVAAGSADTYSIDVEDPADAATREIARVHFPLNFAKVLEKEQPEDLFPLETNNLKTVVVKAKRREGYNSLTGEYDSHHCAQDYVCTHSHGGPEMPGMLNCPWIDREGGLSSAKKPVEGARYLYVEPEESHASMGGDRLVTYHCAAPPIPPFMKAINPISLSRVFPLPESRNNHPVGFSDRTTLYWSPVLTTNASGEVTVSFYAGDLTGRFRCVLQGLSTGGPVYGQAYFAVKQQ